MESHDHQRTEGTRCLETSFVALFIWGYLSDICSSINLLKNWPLLLSSASDHHWVLPTAFCQTKLCVITTVRLLSYWDIAYFYRSKYHVRYYVTGRISNDDFQGRQAGSLILVSHNNILLPRLCSFLLERLNKYMLHRFIHCMSCRFIMYAWKNVFSREKHF